jgi:hypothetical protein
VRWSARFPAHDPQELRSLLDDSTCRQFFSATQGEYTLPNTYDMAAFSFFESHCVPLRYLLDAHPSRVSFVSTYGLSKRSLSDLPGCLVAGDDPCMSGR